MPYGTIFACISLGWAVYALYKTIRLNRENARLRERLREHMANLRQSMEVSAPEYPRIRTLAASQINTGTLTVDIDWDHLRDGNWVQVGFGRMALRDTTANAMRDDEAVQRYVAARDRSRELLLRFLSPAQRRQFEEDESFIALSRSWKPWMVRKGSIDLLDDNGDRIRSYCYLANEAEGLPLYDQMLARKLMVEHHEEQVLRDGVITYDRDAPSDSPEARMRFWNDYFQSEYTPPRTGLSGWAEQLRIRRLNQDVERERLVGTQGYELLFGGAWMESLEEIERARQYAERDRRNREFLETALFSAQRERHLSRVTQNDT